MVKVRDWDWRRSCYSVNGGRLPANVGMLPKIGKPRTSMAP